MGLDPSFLHSEHIAKRLSPEERKKRNIKTKTEAQQIQEARSEKELQGQLEALLRRNNIVVIRQRMDKRTTTAVGTPDILFAAKGTGYPYWTSGPITWPVAWEVKMPKGRPTQEQEEMHAALRDNGWNVRVIRSYREGLAHLKELGIIAEERP